MTGLLLLLAPACWLAVRTGDRRRAQRLQALVGPRVGALVPWRSWRVLRRTVLALAVLLASIAALIPESRASMVAADGRGMDLVVCLDVSRSMLARDVEPDRLTRAKREIIALAGAAQGDRLALVAFAGDARLVVPLTQDALSFAGLAAGLEPSAAGRGGTHIGAALKRAREALPVVLDGDARRSAAVLLLTDGEDLAGGGLAAARALGEAGIVLYCVGFGSMRGSKITVADAGASHFLRNRAGEDVISSLDAPALRRLAEETGGSYVEATSSEAALAEVYTERILPAARASAEGDGQEERGFPYQVPLLLAFLLGTFALWLGEGRRA